MSSRSTTFTAAQPRPTLRRLAASLLAFLFLGAVLILGGRTVSAEPRANNDPAKSLIYAGWYGSIMPTPSFIQANRAFLESQPFNGLAVYMRNPAMTVNATTGIMTSNSMTYATISSVLAPIAGMGSTQLRDNFALVMGNNPPDFFDPWTTTIQNFKNLAAAARDAGLRGVIFDNEQYFSPWGDYPTGVDYPGKSLAEYQAQAVVRGRQVMEAMVAEFPDIVVLTLHGPYISEPDAPSGLFPQWQSGNELLGPFFAGFQEGAARPGQNVDGGELYDLRNADEFDDSYQWRRHQMPSTEVDSKFLSAEARSTWASSVSISYGVYDCPFAGRSMNPTILTSTLSNALKRADRWVWFYAEDNTFLLPPGQGGASTTWIEAVRDALPAGLEPTGPFTRDADTVDMSGGSGGSGGRCGLLGMEVVPLFLALALIRRRRTAKA